MIVYFTCDPVNDASLYISNICMFSNESDVSNIENMFPILFVCFHYPMYVCVMFPINIFLFPNANDVSKRQCIQCMFPIYIEPILSFGHMTVTLHICSDIKVFTIQCGSF